VVVRRRGHSLGEESEVMASENHNQNFKRVVITGLGVASPLGCSVHEFWHRLLEGKSGTVEITDIDLSACRTRIGALVQGYDAAQHFSRKELQRLNRTSQFALVAAAEAIAESRFAQHYDGSRVAVIVGGTIGGFAASEPVYQQFFDDGTMSPFALPYLMNVGPASNVSIRFGFKGPLMHLDGACAASGHAIGYAYRLIQSGVIDAAVCGGADTTLSRAVFQAWSNMRTLSERNNDPARASRPFSLDRDGIVLSEGAGILILESEESALRRDANVYAEMNGYAAASDGYHLTKPSLEGLTRAMRLALADAGLQPRQIDYINAHGTATYWNDMTETAAIKEVFGSAAYEIPVVSIKGALGHSMGATSAFELISCVLSMRDSMLPPTINLTTPDPECDLDYVKEGKRKHEITHAMSNSFAFGGGNAVLIVSRYVPGKPTLKSRTTQL
jgi:3-oxoacyl-[acyl-carrier-protein] synthase II